MSCGSCTSPATATSTARPVRAFNPSATRMTRTPSGCTRIERQLRTSALRLPGKRRGNHAATDRPAFKIERFGIRVGVDGDFRGPAASRGFQSVRKKRPADAQVHESRQDPEIVELPRTTQGGKRVETGDFNSDHCDKGGPRANALRRYGQLGTPALQSFGRITPVRVGALVRRRRNSLTLSLLFCALTFAPTRGREE